MMIWLSVNDETGLFQHVISLGHFCVLFLKYLLPVQWGSSVDYDVSHFPKCLVMNSFEIYETLLEVFERVRISHFFCPTFLEQLCRVQYSSVTVLTILLQLKAYDIWHPLSSVLITVGWMSSWAVSHYSCFILKSQLRMYIFEAFYPCMLTVCCSLWYN